MIIELIALGAVIASVIAIVKHGSVSAALVSAKAEAVLIENEAVKLEGEAKAAILAAVANIKKL
jgi:hypothetical protein